MSDSAVQPARLVAFHNSQAIKDRYLRRLFKHRKADEIVHGYYWRGGKGCAVGCTVHSDDHAAYETELGVPRILARLEDGIFEALPNGRAKDWPIEFLTAIPVGADLSRVWSRFAVWLLGDPEVGVVRYAKSGRARNAIEAIVQAYSLEQSPSEREWRRLASNAAAAAYDDAAAAAAYDAAAAAASPASARKAARENARLQQADKLLELLRAA